MNHTLRICGYLWSANHRMYLIYSASVWFLWFSFQETWLSWKWTAPTKETGGENAGCSHQNCSEFLGHAAKILQNFSFSGLCGNVLFHGPDGSKLSLSQGCRLWFGNEMRPNFMYSWADLQNSSVKCVLSDWWTGTCDCHLTWKVWRFECV